MASEHTGKNKEKNINEKDNSKDSEIKSDPGTQSGTDPQKHMEGPLSSLMHKAGDSFESEETEEEVKKKERNK